MNQQGQLMACTDVLAGLPGGNCDNAASPQQVQMIKQGCPESCGLCDGGSTGPDEPSTPDTTCEDVPYMTNQAGDQLTCAQVLTSLQGDCANPAASEQQREMIAQSCPVTCGLCEEDGGDDNTDETGACEMAQVQIINTCNACNEDETCCTNAANCNWNSDVCYEMMGTNYQCMPMVDCSFQGYGFNADGSCATVPDVPDVPTGEPSTMCDADQSTIITTCNACNEEQECCTTTDGCNWNTELCYSASGTDFYCMPEVDCSIGGTTFHADGSCADMATPETPTDVPSTCVNVNKPNEVADQYTCDCVDATDECITNGDCVVDINCPAKDNMPTCCGCVDLPSVSYQGNEGDCAQVMTQLGTFGLTCTSTMIPQAQLDLIQSSCPVSCGICTPCADMNADCVAATDEPSAPPTKPPTNAGETYKTTFQQTFLGDKTKCGEYKSDIAAANEEYFQVDASKITVTEGEGCEGTSRRRLNTDSLTFDVEVADEVTVDTAAVQAAVTSSLATTQPDLTMVSMTEATLEVDTDSGAANTDDDSSSDSAMLIIIILVVVVVVLCICVIVGFLLMQNKGDEKGGASMEDDNTFAAEGEVKRVPGADTASGMHNQY